MNKTIINTIRKNKKLPHIPSKSKQICETCRHAGKTCGYTAGRCACGLWQGKY